MHSFQEALCVMATELYELLYCEIPNKRELQQIALNHSSDIDFKDVKKLYKKCTAKPYSMFVNKTNLRQQIILYILDTIT